MPSTAYIRNIQSLLESNEGYIQNINDDGAGTTHIGYALPGTADTAAAWRIAEIVVVGTLTTIRFAGGKAAEFQHVWDDGAGTTFASHSYS